MPVARLLAPTPEAAGVDSAALERVFARARREVAEGRLQACQVAVARNGRLAGTRSFGVRPQDGGAVRDTDLFNIFSSTKAVLGVAMWQLIEAGKVDVARRVVDYIPEFGTHGKERVLVLHVLNFTAGFPSPGGSLISTKGFGDSAARCASFAKWELAWEPGSRWEYHALSAHWVMAEIVERVTGVEWRAYVRAKILDPAGLCDFFVGIPEAQQPARTFVELTKRARGGEWRSGAAVNAMHRPAVRALGVPAGGGLATAADLALLYQPLLNGGAVYEGPRLVRADTITRGTTRTTDERHVPKMMAGEFKDVMEPAELRNFLKAMAADMFGSMPPVSDAARAKLAQRQFPVPKLRGWVMELAGGDVAKLRLPPPPESADHKGLDLRAAFGDGAEVPAMIFRQGCFGLANSPGSFGHDGAHGQIAWGDPVTGISFAFVHNTFESREFGGPRHGHLVGMGLERYVEMGTLANAAALITPPPSCVVNGMHRLREMQARLTSARARL